MIYPEVPDTFWSFKHALKFIRKRASLPPLGLATVAAMLPEDWTPRLVDCNVTRLKKADLKWADLAMVSAMLVQKDSTHEVVARCKEAGLPIVAGGPLFSDPAERLEAIDHFVLGEAENAFAPFLEDFKRGRARREYSIGEFPDVAAAPTPRWDLVDLKRYASASVQYSRGCPFNCEFCNVTSLFGHKPRIKSADQVVAELDTLWDLGWRDNVFFVDDNFIGNRKRLKNELLPALIEWRRSRPGMTFYTEASIDLADDPEMMDMMVEAGFRRVFIGIETPDDESLAECHKVQNRQRDLVADVKRIHNAGLRVQAGFIVGFDSDTPTIFERQIEFIQNSGIVTAMVGLLQAMPGTKLFERMKAEGRLKGFTTGDNVDGSTNIVSRMDPEMLREGYRRILKTIYSPKHYYRRVRVLLEDYHLPKVKTPVRFGDVAAFIRSAWRLGIVGRERVHYWKLLFWTRRKRPELFSLAVTLAIYGHHFRRTCRKALGTSL